MELQQPREWRQLGFFIGNVNMKQPKKDRKWRLAIRALNSKLEGKRREIKPRSMQFAHLPLDIPGALAWEVVTGGVPYRCVVQYAICPPHGYEAGYLGRVDVLYE